MLAPIFEDEGLFDERPCESGRRSANAKYFAGKPLIIGLLAREASEQSIPEQGAVPTMSATSQQPERPHLLLLIARRHVPEYAPAAG